MSGLMSSDVMKMRELLSLLQGDEFAMRNLPRSGGSSGPSYGPAYDVANMITQGAGGAGAAGLYQGATGQDPLSMMQSIRFQHGPRQMQEGSGPQAPPQAAPQEQQMNPALQAMYLKFMDEAASFGITDPGEQADYALEMVQLTMEGQGQ